MQVCQRKDKNNADVQREWCSLGTRMRRRAGVLYGGAGGGRGLVRVQRGDVGRCA